MTGTRGVQFVMVGSGLLTATMFYAAFDPGAALQSSFGESLDGPLAEIVVRNWGALIGLVGLSLIYGAFNPGARRLALSVAVASKIVFIALVLGFGRQYLDHQIGIAVAVDTIMVLTFAVFLLRFPERERAVRGPLR